MNLGKIVLQVGCSDKIISQYPVHLFIILALISLNKNIYVRKQNNNVLIQYLLRTLVSCDIVH